MVCSIEEEKNRNAYIRKIIRKNKMWEAPGSSPNGDTNLPIKKINK